MNKNEAKRCEDYANFVYTLNVEQYVKDNFKSVMTDSVYRRSNCVDRYSGRGYCNDCKELVSKSDVEIESDAEWILIKMF